SASAARRRSLRNTAVQEPPHLSEFVLDFFHAAHAHQLEDQAVDALFHFRNDPSLVRSAIERSRRPGHRLRSPPGPAPLPGTPAPGPLLAGQSLLRPDLVDQGPTDAALVPRRRPRLIDHLVADFGVTPELPGDECRLPPIAAPPGGPLGPASL